MCSNLHLHTGIEFEQLVSELRLGVRLPSPPYCPFGIVEIMKKCFHENPHQRPKFEEVRISLTRVISELRRPSTPKNQNVNVDSNMSVVYSDLAMKEQYMLMRKEHGTLHSILHSIEEVEEDPTAHTLSFQKSVGDSMDIMDRITQKEHLSYASLLNTTALALNSSLNMNDDTDQESVGLIRNAGKGHTNHGNGCRKYMTYSFEHISKNTLVQEPLFSSVSLNPIYMLSSYSKGVHQSSDFELVTKDTTAHPRST